MSQNSQTISHTPQLIENEDSQRLVEAHWTKSSDLCLRLGVKSHTARQVLLGRWICGKSPQAIPDESTPLAQPFIETPLSDILGRAWVDDYTILDSEFIPASVMKKIQGPRTRHKIRPRDLQRMVTRPRLKIFYHPLMRIALKEYLICNGVLTRQLSRSEAHWISCNELMARLQKAKPSVSIMKQGKLSGFMKEWADDPNLEIELRSPKGSQYQPASQVIGFRQKDSGGLPGWWIDGKAFHWVHHRLLDDDTYVPFLNDERWDKYQSVRRLSREVPDSKFTIHYIYTQGLAIVELWYERLQENPEGYIMRYSSKGSSRRCTIRPDSMVFGRRLGASAVLLNPLLRRTLIAILEAGVTYSDLEDCQLSSLLEESS